MAGARKRGANRYNLFLGPLTGSSTTDTAATFVYDGFAEGASTASGWAFPYDVTSEVVTEASISVGTTLTGTSTNFAAFAFRQYRGSSTVVNDIQVVYSGSGITSSLGLPVNLNVASGAVATGAGTGVLTVQSGSALPWTLIQGDTLAFARVTTGTGLATPAANLTFVTKQSGA